MKKIFIALGTVLFLSACTQFVKETAPEFPNYVAAPTVEQIDDDELDPDSEFTVKVTPGAGNIYYAFAIIPGTEAKDASALISNKYAGNAVKVKLIIEEVETEVPLSGSFAAAKQADTVVTAFNLKPNTAYTVYAVGAGENGALSAVTAHTIITTDSTLPGPFDGKKYNFSAKDLEDGTFVVDFGDEVEFTEELQNGEAKFYATDYGANAYDKQGILLPVFSAEIPVDSLSVSGSEVSIQVPERIPGAVVAISYDAGVVVNGVDLKNTALPADESGAYWNASGKLVTAGLAARFETKDWKFELPMIENEEGKEVKMPSDTIIFFNDYEALEISLTGQNLVEPIHQDAEFNYLVPAEAIQIRYTDGSNRKIIYASEDIVLSDVSDSTVVITLGEEPEYGATVSVDIPASAVEDLWGNPCKAFSTAYVDEDGEYFPGNYFYSYGYTREDFLGTYSYAGEASNGNVHEEAAVVIAPDPESETGILIYDLFKSLEPLSNRYFTKNWDVLTAPIPGEVNIHDGSISLANSPIVKAESDILAGYGYAGIITVEYGETSWYLQRLPNGDITTPVEFYYILGAAGYIAYEEGDLTKISSEYSVPTSGDGGSAAPVRKKAARTSRETVPSGRTKFAR